jgi:3-oxoacyl-[acyl-carrier protein] reductase
MNGNSEVTAQPITSFKGRVAVITGGATGIGLAIALELAKEDAKIVVASTNKNRLEEAAAEIKNAGASETLSVVCDVSSRDSVKILHNTVMEKYGQCDLLFCNAGVTTAGPYLEHRPEDWDWVYGIVPWVQPVYETCSVMWNAI